MDSTAKITSKGQVTIPKRVRDALELHEGDELLFRVERSRAVIAKTPSLLDWQVASRSRPRSAGLCGTRCFSGPVLLARQKRH